MWQIIQSINYFTSLPKCLSLEIISIGFTLCGANASVPHLFPLIFNSLSNFDFGSSAYPHYFYDHNFHKLCLITRCGYIDKGLGRTDSIWMQNGLKAAPDEICQGWFVVSCCVTLLSCSLLSFNEIIKHNWHCLTLWTTCPIICCTDIVWHQESISWIEKLHN